MVVDQAPTPLKEIAAICAYAQVPLGVVTFVRALVELEATMPTAQ